MRSKPMPVSEAFEEEQKIAKIWREISYDLRRFDPDLSREIFIKGLFWSDESQRRESRRELVIGLEEVVSRAIKIHPDHKAFARDPTVRLFLGAVAKRPKLADPELAPIDSVQTGLQTVEMLIDNGYYRYSLPLLRELHDRAAKECSAASVKREHIRFLKARVLDAIGQSEEALPLVTEVVERCRADRRLGPGHPATETGEHLLSIVRAHIGNTPVHVDPETLKWPWIRE